MSAPGSASAEPTPPRWRSTPAPAGTRLQPSAAACDRRCRRASRVVRRASRPRLYRGRPDRPGRCDRGGGASVGRRAAVRVGVEAEAGRHRLRERADTAAFGHSAGPQSWKSVLHPARARLWSADRATGSVEAGEAAEPPRYALLGVRPCDVRAVGILDQVLTGGRHADPVYRGRRDGVFIIAVECTEPGATCFCTSMGCGPGVESGFDLAMTELADAEGHRFVVRAGTPAGADVLSDVPRRAADEATRRRASTAVDEAPDHMGPPYRPLACRSCWPAAASPRTGTTSPPAA